MSRSILRIVGTQTLRVHDTITLQKQISGYEVGVGVSVFGSELFDINIGAQNQEPLQLGVRWPSCLSAVLQLVGGSRTSIPHLHPPDIMLVL